MDPGFEGFFFWPVGFVILAAAFVGIALGFLIIWRMTRNPDQDGDNWRYRR